MLLAQHARGEAGRIVTRQHRHGGLNHDRPVVKFGRDEMHRRAMHFAARRECARVRVETGKRWQQRWMNVDQASGIMLHKGGREDAHEAGQHNQIRRMCVDHLHQRGVERLARGIVAMWQSQRSDAARARRVEAFGVGAIADDCGDPGVQPAGVLGRQQRLQVAAAPGDQDDQLFDRRPHGVRNSVFHSVLEDDFGAFFTGRIVPFHSRTTPVARLQLAIIQRFAWRILPPQC